MLAFPATWTGSRPTPPSPFPTNMATLSLKGSPGPTTNGNDAWQGQGMSTLTCPHLTMSLHPHVPHHHAPHPLHITGPSSPHAPQEGAHAPCRAEVLPSPGRIPCAWFQATAGQGVCMHSC